MNVSSLSLRTLVFRRVLPTALAACLAIWAFTAYVAHGEHERQVAATLMQRMNAKAALMVARVQSVDHSVRAVAGNSITIGALVGQDIDRVVRPFLRSISFAGAETVFAAVLDYRGRLIVADRPDAWVEPVWLAEDFPDVMAGGVVHRLDSRGLVFLVPILLGDTIEGALIVRLSNASLFDAMGDKVQVAGLFVAQDHREHLALTHTRGGLSGQVIRPIPMMPGVAVRLALISDRGGFWSNPVQGFLIGVFLLVICCLVLSVHVAAGKVTSPIGRLIDELSVRGLNLGPPARDAPQEVRTLTKRFMAAAHDVEDALVRERELTAQQRQFVSMVSHEFRTPLSIIDGAAGALQRRRARMDDAAIGVKLDVIRAAVTRLIRLMEATLVAARMDAGGFQLNRKALRLAEVAAALVDERRTISADATIEVDLDGLPETIEADDRLLYSVFDNLLSNAVKYARGKPELKVRGWREGDMACLAVSDNGVGIPEAELDRIGQRFFRASTSTGIVGTGIGLNMVRTVLRLHGGELRVESREGVGSTFTAVLPIVAPAADEADEAVPLVDPTRRLWRLVYSSVANETFIQSDLEALVHDADFANARMGVTGCLIFREGVFVQALEGQREKIERLLAVIRRDPRHRDVKLCLSEPAQERAYPGWRMAMGVAPRSGDLVDAMVEDIRRRCASAAAGAVDAA